MSYDDIRFSGWDDPDDDETEGDIDNDPYYMDDDGYEYGSGLSWDDPIDMEGEEVYIVYEGECNMCGRERNINDSGYCAQCWIIWNS